MNDLATPIAILFFFLYIAELYFHRKTKGHLREAMDLLEKWEPIIIEVTHGKNDSR